MNNQIERGVVKIIPPIECLTCGSKLVWRNDVLYCENKICDAIVGKQVEHFAKTLKIKGLGPATIEKLELSSISEIYEIDLNYIIFQLKSEKMGLKLFEEIQKSKNTQLNTLLPAFGIPLVGKTAADKLSQICESIFDVDEQICKAAGLGEKTTANLMNWLRYDFEKFSNLPFSFEFEPPATENLRIVCITGKLNSYPSKAKAKEVLEQLGYTVKDRLTKDVTILVNESGKITDKVKKADANGIRIVTNIHEIMENN